MSHSPISRRAESDARPAATTLGWNSVRYLRHDAQPELWDREAVPVHLPRSLQRRLQHYPAAAALQVGASHLHRLRHQPADVGVVLVSRLSDDPKALVISHQASAFSYQLRLLAEGRLKADGYRYVPAKSAQHAAQRLALMGIDVRQ
jgi:hypothetical protein